MASNNLILTTDSYKASHFKQYPPKSQRVHSFFESRGGVYRETTFFGLQSILKNYLVPGFGWGDIIEAQQVIEPHMGPESFNRQGWEELFADYQGRLPLRIRAVPEGTTVPVGNVLMTVESTDDHYPWLVNYMETLLSQVWYPTTVCTQSRFMKRRIKESLEKTGDVGGLGFKLHDFGFRGSTSVESAGIGGAAHLVNFMGSDTLAGIMVARRDYGCPMAGFSIPAAEHSTITSWGREHEVEAFRNMLTNFPKGLVAVVSDSYDIFKACSEHWGRDLKSEVLARDGVLVVRPDSGDPAKVVSEVLSILGAKFGFTVNSKGYKVLDPHVRVIQGDGINVQSLDDILTVTELNGWSTDNIAFGSGGGLLQNVNRDTCKFAFKASAIKIDGEWHDVYKEPITDPGKNSKRGRLGLFRDTKGNFTTERMFGEMSTNLLQVVFENGRLVNEQSFADIRQRSEVGL